MLVMMIGDNLKILLLYYRNYLYFTSHFNAIISVLLVSMSVCENTEKCPSDTIKIFQRAF